MGIYEELGIRKVINCLGPYTKVGGSLMPEEVVKTMHEAAKSFVSIDELLEKSGEKIAEITGAPAAFITSGAAAGLAVSAAACMAGSDPMKAKQLPDTSGMKDEITIHRCHRIHYDQAVRLTGARFVEIGFSDWSDADDLKQYINSETAAILYVAKFESLNCSIPLDKVIKVAHYVKIPVIVDAADELPPASNLHKFINMGADLVIFSGGKGLRGPQGSGLILGDKDLIKACSVNANPNYGIGRSMKVDKEEIAGLTKAIELYVKKDFESEMQFWERQQEYIMDKLSGVSHIKCTTHKPVSPGAPGSFYLPAVYIDLDKEGLFLTKSEIIQKLWEENPRIAVDELPTGIVIRLMMMESGQEKKVVEKLLEIFK
jgi:L-seryl-tRNA(Ser) seleniumtransferase